MSDQLIECNHNHPDCFAWYCGGCQALCAQIRDKECPFYKTNIEYDLGIAHRKTYNPRIDDVIKGWEERMGRKDGKKMMFITFSDEELLTKCFSEWVYDHDAIDYGNQDREAQVRCAIIGFTHYVRHFLIDYYNVDIKEEGEI